MLEKLFDTERRVGRWVACISLTALFGCGGIVIDDRTDGGKADAAVDSAIAPDTLELDTSTPPPPVEDSSPTPADAPSSEPCNACVEDRCSAEYDACASSADCVAVVQCVNDCGTDSACANACIRDDMAGELFSRLIECAQTKCSAECF